MSPSGTALSLKTRKHLALLVYLAVDPAALHRRDRLMDLFWPSALDSARGSLSTALSMLRARLGRQAIEADRDNVRLDRRQLVVDLERLEAGDVVGDESTPPLEVDGFLAGFEIPDAPEFGIWRDAQHARLLPAIKSGLIRLMDLARRTADARAMGRYADRLLAIDDLAEEGIRARMEASALSGDRLSALRTYDEWVARLQRDLDAVPPPLLEGMALRLRRRGWDRPVTAVPTVRTEQWQDRPFIGRKREFRVLYETWERVTSGEARHVVLQGESGVGKTTLADRLATAASLEGATISRVRCFELERGIPYAAIGGVLAPLLDRPGAAATSPEALAELGRVIPEIRGRYANLPEPLDTPGESARIRFAEAALELLQALMEEHPVVLTVDDFHLADEASLAVLHLLMRRTRGCPFMVMLATTEHASEGSTNGARIRAGASALGVTVLEVEPMPEGDREQLLDALVQTLRVKPGRTERRAILSAAGGYPMALELMLRDWEEHGAKSLALAYGAMTAEVPTDLDTKYRSLAERITQSVDPAGRTVLQMAAILDRRLNDLEMYRLVDLTAGQTITGLATLAHRRALRDTGTGLEFVNPSVRAHAYVTTPPSLRKLLHNHVAEILLERHASGVAIPGLELAWHCVRGGIASQARPHLLRGGREAIGAGAPHEAILGLKSGMHFLASDEQEEASLLIAEALQESSAMAESLAWLQRHDSWIGSDRPAMAYLLRTQAKVALWERDPSTTEEDVVRLLDLVATSRSSTVRSRAALLATRIALLLGTPHLIDRVSPLLKRGVEPEAAPLDQLNWLLAEAMYSYHIRQIQSAKILLEGAVQIVESQALKNSIAATTQVGLGVICNVAGRYADGLKHFELAYGILTSLDNATNIASPAVNIALCHGRIGNYREQLAWADRVISMGVTHISTTSVLQALNNKALALAMLGEGREATRVSDLALEHANTQRWRQWSLLIAADVAQVRGRISGACDLAFQAIGQPSCDPADLGLIGIHARWTARLGAVDVIPKNDARLTLEKALAEWDRCDTIDKAEILIGLELLELLDAEARLMKEKVLNELPEATRTQLAILSGRLFLGGAQTGT